MARLGDILVNHGAITRPILEQSLPGMRGLLGHFLRAHTLVRGRPLARALAEQQGLPFLLLEESPADPSLFRPTELAHYLAHRYLPHRHIGSRLAVVTPEPSLALKATLETHYRCPIDLQVIPARDFTRAVNGRGATALTRRARVALRRRLPMLVADRVLNPPQMHGLSIAALLIAGAGIFFPTLSWHALLVCANLFYVTTLAFKLVLYRAGLQEDAAIRTGLPALDARVRALDETSLPVYSVLVPIYRENFAVLARLISHLHALDYPKEKLDIKLIVEADDEGTIAALKACRPPDMMEIIHVAPSLPRTKPKACNVALQHVRGDYLVIFDAEDAPEPMQLKRAIAMFTSLPPTIACLQGALNYYNRDENLLTRLFAIEYASLFHQLLPALQRLKLPIPLGGTSNHLRVAALTHVGGWDAFNVTEDADLGMRLSYFGYETRLLPSLTLEESPIRLLPWLRQRTRWIKGYIQTWLVYMRDPHTLHQRLGTRGYYGFQFFVGAPALTFLLAPVFWFIFLLGALGLLPGKLPTGMLELCLLSFAGGILSHWLFARAAIRRDQWPNMGLALAVYPFYWLLHSLAAARALWQLATSPHYWDKTTHGVTRLFRLKMSKR